MRNRTLATFQVTERGYLRVGVHYSDPVIIPMPRAEAKQIVEQVARGARRKTRELRLARGATMALRVLESFWAMRMSPVNVRNAIEALEHALHPKMPPKTKGDNDG